MAGENGETSGLSLKPTHESQVAAAERDQKIDLLSLLSENGLVMEKFARTLENVIQGWESGPGNESPAPKFIEEARKALNLLNALEDAQPEMYQLAQPASAMDEPLQLPTSGNGDAWNESGGILPMMPDNMANGPQWKR
jgi:hypothetical protein